MIVEHYPNPNKPAAPAVVAYVPSQNSGMQMLNGHGLNFNQHWANKLNLQLHVFVGRDKRVQDEASKVAFEKNAVVWPRNEDDYKKDGRCRVLSVTRSYRDWPEDRPWEDTGFCFVVEAYSEVNKFSVFITTGNYFTTVKPSFVKDEDEQPSVGA